jgi:hypothetical protein
MTLEPDQNPQTRKPHAGTWLAVGAPVGVALGAAFDQLALGLALGVTFGSVIDVIMHMRYKKRQ